MTTPRALLSLLVPSLVLPACTPQKVCIGDCPEVEQDSSDNEPTSDTEPTGEPTGGHSTDPTWGSSTMSDSFETDGGDSTGDETDGPDPTGGEVCELAFESDFDHLAGCEDGVQNPKEFCFTEGFSSGVFNELRSIRPVRVDSGGVDVMVSQDDRTASVMLDGPAPILDLNQVDWVFQMPEGTLELTDAGDVDEDGVQDIAARNLSTVPGEHVAYSFTLAADGNMKGLTNQALGEIRFGPALVDWNQDDHLDQVVVAVVPGEDVPAVVVRPGDGTGNFTAEPQAIEFPSQHHLFALGALDEDGVANDFASAGTSGDIVVTLTPSRLAPLEIFTTANHHVLEIADLDGNGLGDVVALYDDLDNNDRATIAVFLQQPSDPQAQPAFTKTDYLVLCGTTVMALGDLDGDGALDIVSGAPAGPIVMVRRGDGQGGFEEIVGMELATPVDRLFIADFDGNGANDILTLDLAGSFLAISRNMP